ncbi:MAG: hypothetical protein JXN65_08620 [Clostridia bacterium]|nr:hypothetical protein [Clostridia bacterium]
MIMNNAARRLDEREYTQQYTYPQRKTNLRVLENNQENRNFNDSRTYTTVHYHSNSNAFLSQLITTVIILFLFVSCIGFLAIQAQITQVERDISRLNSEIYELSTENNMMQNIITSATNIETIRENAEKLGMGKPDAEDVIYISESELGEYTMSSGSLGN